MSYKLNIRSGGAWENLLKDVYVEIDNSNWTSTNLNGFLDEISASLEDKKTRNVVRTDSNYTASPFDVIMVDTSLNEVTITLPSTANDGDEIYIADIVGNSSSNNITISPSGGNTINGSSTATISDDYGYSKILFDSTESNWYIAISSASSGIINLDTSYTVTGTEPTGTLYWDSNSNTASLVMEGDSIQQIGEEIYYPLQTYNNTSNTITNGTPVMTTGGTGYLRYIIPAISDDSIPSILYLGVATEDIAPSAFGRITYFGYVNDIDTSQWPKETQLYVDPVSAGYLTSTKPTSPDVPIPVGVVTYQDSVNGQIFVRYKNISIASEINYDNEESLLLASNVQSAIDELQQSKAGVSQLSSNIVLYPTSTESTEVSGYYRMVSSPTDPDYDDFAVDYILDPLTGTEGSPQLLGQLVSDPGLFVGNPGVVSIPTIGNIAKIDTNPARLGEFYFTIYKREDDTTETLVATSNMTDIVDPGDTNYHEFSATALLNNGEWLSTDRIVIRYWGIYVGSSGGEYQFQFGGNTPVRTNIAVPVSVLPSSLAEDILVDTVLFNGLLGPTDDNVQSALETLDDHNHDTRYINSTGGDSMSGNLTLSTGDLILTTGDITLSTNATVDGRDISEDGLKLDSLTLSGASNKDFLQYDTTSGTYVPRTYHEAGIAPLIEGEPNGFIDKTQIYISVDEGTRTVSLSGDHDIYADGILYNKTSDDIIFDDNEGYKYIYYDDSGVLSVSNSFSSDYISKYCFICSFYWDTTNNKIVPWIVNELHGHKMPSSVHEYLHLVNSSVYINGIALSLTADGNDNLDSSCQFTSSIGTIRDEDIVHTIKSKDNLTDTLPVLWREGATGVWRMDDTRSFPVVNIGAGRAAYNEWTGTTFQLTEVTNGNFFLIHLFAIPGPNPSDGGLVSIIGQEEYTNSSDAREGIYVEARALDLSNTPVEEYKLIASVICRTADNYTNTPKTIFVSTDTGADFIDWRYDVPTSILASVSNVSWGTITGTLSNQIDIQDALDNKVNIITSTDNSVPTFNLTNGQLQDKGVIFIDDDNEVGIRNSSPTATLDVSGSVYVDGPLTVTGNFYLAPDSLTNYLKFDAEVVSTGVIDGDFPHVETHIETASLYHYYEADVSSGEPSQNDTVGFYNYTNVISSGSETTTDYIYGLRNIVNIPDTETVNHLNINGSQILITNYSQGDINYLYGNSSLVQHYGEGNVGDLRGNSSYAYAYSLTNDVSLNKILGDIVTSRLYATNTYTTSASSMEAGDFSLYLATISDSPSASVYSDSCVIIRAGFHAFDNNSAGTTIHTNTATGILVDYEGSTYTNFADVNYGLYITDVTNAAPTSYAIYSEAGDSYFGGGIEASFISVSYLNIDNITDLKGETDTLTTTSQTEIASFVANSYKSGKFLIQVNDTVTGEVQLSELLIVHDGTTASATEYGVVYTGSNVLATFDVDINSGNVRLLATGASANSTTYKVSETLITA